MSVSTSFLNLNSGKNHMFKINQLTLSTWAHLPRQICLLSVWITFWVTNWHFCFSFTGEKNILWLIRKLAVIASDYCPRKPPLTPRAVKISPFNLFPPFYGQPWPFPHAAAICSIFCLVSITGKIMSCDDQNSLALLCSMNMPVLRYGHWATAPAGH